MALIKCTDCGNEVSDRAAACPKCGGPIRRQATRQPPVTYQQTTTLLSRRKVSPVTAGCFLLIAVVMMGGIIQVIIGWLGSSNSNDQRPRVNGTAVPPHSDPAHPDAFLLSDAEKKFFGAAGGYLNTVHDHDFRLATVMAGAQSGDSTLGNIKSAISRARSVEEAAYFGDYKSAAVPSTFEALDKKIDRCRRLHDSAFEELLEYWGDSNLAHIESGNATLRQAVIAANECVSALNATIDALKRERRLKTNTN